MRSRKIDVYEIDVDLDSLDEDTREAVKEAFVKYVLEQTKPPPWRQPPPRNKYH